MSSVGTMSASVLPLDKISAAPSSPSPVDSYRYRELMEQSLAAEIEAAEAEILRLHERQAVMKAVDSQDASVGTLASAGAGWTPPRGRSRAAATPIIQRYKLRRIVPRVLRMQVCVLALHSTRRLAFCPLCVPCKHDPQMPFD